MTTYEQKYSFGATIAFKYTRWGTCQSIRTVLSIFENLRSKGQKSGVSWETLAASKHHKPLLQHSVVRAFTQKVESLQKTEISQHLCFKENPGKAMTQEVFMQLRVMIKVPLITRYIPKTHNVAKKL